MGIKNKNIATIGSVVIMLAVGVSLMSSYKNVEPEEPSKHESNAIQKVIAPEVPEEVIFAGETMPLDNFDIYESLDRELIVNSFYHSQTIRLLKLKNRYFSVIEPILKENGIPEDFKYLAVAESALNEKAVSPAGAVGIWQFMKATAKDYGLEVTSEVDERYNMEKETVAACNYLKNMYSYFGNWMTVMASFNAGKNGIDKQMIRQKENHYFDLQLNDETSRYVFRIVALKLILESPEKYGFYVSKHERYPKIPFKYVEVNSSITSLVDFAKEQGVNYKILKMMNPWLRDTLLTVKEGKSYQIKIPEKRNLYNVK